jgi:hypothetical protein
MSLIHLKNGTLGSIGHCVSVEQKNSELFTNLPMKAGDLNVLNVRRSGRSSYHEVYEKILKARKDKVLSSLYCLVKQNALYQEYDVVIDPSSLDWMGDENECILPMPCTIHTEQDTSPEDDNTGPSAGKTLMDNLDKMEGIDMEVSGTMSNTDCALSTEEDAWLLEEIWKSKAGK